MSRWNSEALHQEVQAEFDAPLERVEDAEIDYSNWKRERERSYKRGWKQRNATKVNTKQRNVRATGRAFVMASKRCKNCNGPMPEERWKSKRGNYPVHCSFQCTQRWSKEKRKAITAAYERKARLLERVKRWKPLCDCGEPIPFTLETGDHPPFCRECAYLKRTEAARVRTAAKRAALKGPTP